MSALEVFAILGMCLVLWNPVWMVAVLLAAFLFGCSWYSENNNKGFRFTMRAGRQ